MFKKIAVIIVEALIERLTNVRNWLEPVVEAPVVVELPTPQPKKERKPLFTGATVDTLYSLVKEIEGLDLTQLTLNSMLLFKQLIEECRLLETAIGNKTVDFANRAKICEILIMEALPGKEDD